MDSRKIMLLVGALIFAALTAFMARSLISGAGAPGAGANVGPVAAPEIKGPKVLVATRALPVGTILDAQSMKFQPWPQELVENAYFVEGADTDISKLQGTVVRFEIPAGQPITQGTLVKPGDRGFLAAALGPGMRAVTVPVSTSSAVAGFVFPGDRIDLVLTQSVAGGGDGPPLRVSETILRNLRVLATDQRTSNDTDENGKTVVHTYSNVTLEVTPKIAEEIAVAQTVGSLSLSLRSIADNAGDLENAIANGQVDVPDKDDPDAEKRMIARVAASPQGGPGSFSTGADVSRYQRSSIPAKSAPSGDGSGGSGAPAGGAFPGAGAVQSGPVVRVARGNNVTAVSVGGK